MTETWRRINLLPRSARRALAVDLLAIYRAFRKVTVFRLARDLDVSTEMIRSLLATARAIDRSKPHKPAMTERTRRKITRTA